ncbi:hypothetical protein [Lentzea aerocolonigenes]|uniref:hypothetical protein n=1 Tax=Lentzea aerocolonigenes TaxID=68170 RepID=UPI000B187BEE|nr:hypothetical protein [Lentzea aerocolonigenes]MCP2244970.1 hypothetical protein [Lentzea aerocolonigenes]
MTGEKDETVQVNEIRANIISGDTAGVVMQIGHIAGDVVLNARESTENDQG